MKGGCYFVNFNLYFRFSHTNKIYLVVFKLLFVFYETKFAKKGLHFYKWQILILIGEFSQLWDSAPPYVDSACKNAQSQSSFYAFTVLHSTEIQIAVYHVHCTHTSVHTMYTYQSGNITLLLLTHRNVMPVCRSPPASAWAATISVESSPFGVFPPSRYFKVYTCQCCNITFCIWRIIAFAWAATICVESSPFRSFHFQSIL